MGHQLHMGQMEPLPQEPQAPGVVVVAVGQHDMSQAAQINAHGFGVLQNDIGIPRVKQDAQAVGLQVVADRRLPQVVLVDVSVVIHQDPELHCPLPSPYRNMASPKLKKRYFSRTASS